MKMQTTASPSNARPVQESERIQIVDILRGFALFGILLVNMELFSHPIQAFILPADPNMPWYDQAAQWLVRFLAEGKFYALFSFLFGLGLTLQMGRVQARGGHFVSLYARRLLVLLVIGLIHAFFIWIGDILTLYALLGFVLLLFRKAQPRTLLIWAGVFWILPLLLNFGTAGLMALGRSVPDGAAQIDAIFAEQSALFQSDAARALAVYGGGSWMEITAQRALDMQFIAYGNLLGLAPNVLAMFLVGMYFGKRQIFQNIEQHLPLFRKLMLWGFVIGVPGNLIYATFTPSLSRLEPSFLLSGVLLAHALGAPALMLAYMSTLTLLSRQPIWGKRFRTLAPVGQMALTNYLTQSLICTFIFYSYGVGLYGQVGTALGLVFAVIIYALQIPFSHWWLGHFLYGPMEWLWRSLIYLQPQPMRRNMPHLPRGSGQAKSA